MTASDAVLVAERARPVAGDRRERGRSTAWWGMVLLITTEAMLFSGLLSAYFFVRAGAPHWPLGGIEEPALGRISIFSVVLWASTLPVVWAERGIKAGDVRRLQVGLLAGFLLGLAFVVHQFAVEWPDLRFGWGDTAYGSLFYTITGLHGLHVVAGLAMSLVVQIKAWTGRYDAEHHATVELFGLYWHFVDVVWVFVFSSLYLSVRLLGAA